MQQPGLKWWMTASGYHDFEIYLSNEDQKSPKLAKASELKQFTL